MKRFVEGQDRRQATLLPECLDDYGAPDNPVRIIEAFVDELDLAALGFAGVVPEATGRPSYHPATLLKIYIYGYLNRVPSSRRLERETQRNLELIWLTGRLMPDVKTIADFRRDNGPAIRYNGDEVLACEGTGVVPYVPKTQTSGNTNRGLFTGQDFIYDAEHDRYTCPAGQHLTKGKVRSDRRDTIDHYRNLTACPSCALKPRCTPDTHKRVKRWQHEDVLDRMQARLERMPEAMLMRRQTVEHPFGTIKAWMGSTHFLTKTLEKVRTEMSLHVLAYNLKRMISILGVGPLLRALAV